MRLPSPVSVGVAILALAFLGSHVASAAPAWTMKDVQALAAAKSWNELLAGAENVPPASRGSDWAGLVSQAARARLQALTAEASSGSQAQELVDLVTKSEAKYGFLRSDSAYMKSKSGALASLVGLCEQTRAVGCAACLEAVSRGLQTFPKGAAAKIAMLMGEEDRFPSETLRYWAIAAEEDRASCEMGALQNGAFTALGSENAELNATGVKVAKLCYAKLEPGFIDQLKSSAKGSAFANNVCPMLKAHGKTSMIIRDQCP
jgi:hypothetical protein